MALLLDVNVLIALIDPLHTLHEPAHTWFAQRQPQAWATCPITENAVLRIVGNPRYPNSPGTPAAVVPVLASLTAQVACAGPASATSCACPSGSVTR